jgi:hypothetical protein
MTFWCLSRKSRVEVSIFEGSRPDVAATGDQKFLNTWEGRNCSRETMFHVGKLSLKRSSSVVCPCQMELVQVHFSAGYSQQFHFESLAVTIPNWCQGVLTCNYLSSLLENAI